ncbi:MAG: phosphoribosylglycinamide formyltransferase 2, partial [Desulfurococcaceae archaeon]
ATQELSEFAIHVRALLGLPVPKPRILTPGASIALYVDEDSKWNCVLEGVYKALETPGVDIRIFGKPQTYRGRRMAVILARGTTVEDALSKARSAKKLLQPKCTW